MSVQKANQDIAQALAERPWLQDIAKTFVAGLRDSGISVAEAFALLGSAMVSGILAQTQEPDLDRFADLLEASANQFLRAVIRVLTRHPDILAAMEKTVDEPEETEVAFRDAETGELMDMEGIDKVAVIHRSHYPNIPEDVLQRIVQDMSVHAQGTIYVIRN